MKALLAVTVALALFGCATPQMKAEWHAVAVSKCTLSGHKPGTDKHDACTLVEEFKQRQAWENQVREGVRYASTVSYVAQQRVRAAQAAQPFPPAPQTFPSQINVTIQPPQQVWMPRQQPINYGLRVRPY